MKYKWFQLKYQSRKPKINNTKLQKLEPANWNYNSFLNWMMIKSNGSLYLKIKNKNPMINLMH